MTRPAESWADVDAWAFPPPEGPRRCAWPACGARFDARLASQRFCGRACREAAKDWRKAHGSALVEPLLVWIANRSARDGASRARAAAARRFVFERARDLLDDLARRALERADVAEARRIADPADPTAAVRALSDLGLSNRAICAALSINTQTLTHVRRQSERTPT